MEDIDSNLYMEELTLVLEREYAAWLNIPASFLGDAKEAIGALLPSIDPILIRLQDPLLKKKKVLDKSLLFCYRILEKAFFFPIHETYAIDWVDHSHLPTMRFVLYEARGIDVHHAYWHDIGHLFATDIERSPP